MRIADRKSPFAVGKTPCAIQKTATAGEQMLLFDPNNPNDHQTFAISELQMTTSDGKNLFPDRKKQKANRNLGLVHQQTTNSGRLFAISGQ
jgi:hypothetical protein